MADWTQVQHTYASLTPAGQTGAQQVSQSWGATVSSGSIIAGVGYCNTVATIPSITDDKGNPYTVITIEDAFSDIGGYAFYGGPFSNGPTELILNTVNPGFFVVVAADEFQPPTGFSASFDQSAILFVGNGTTCTPGPLTPSKNDALFWSGEAQRTGATQSAGWTLTSTSADFAQTAYQIQAIAASDSNTWTFGSNATMAGVLFVFIASPGTAALIANSMLAAHSQILPVLTAPVAAQLLSIVRGVDTPSSHAGLTSVSNLATSLQGSLSGPGLGVIINLLASMPTNLRSWLLGPRITAIRNGATMYAMQEPRDMELPRENRTLYVPVEPRKKQ